MVTAGRSLPDAHAHLSAPEFADDLEAVLARAAAAGVGPILAVAETIADACRNLELAACFPGQVRAAAGLYPTHLDPARADAMQAFIRAQRDRLWAIGEVGLDYWKVQDEAGRELQRRIFRGFIELAAELRLPLSVHSRAAGRHAVALLLELDAQRVVLHAFDGRPGAASPAVDAGFYFSIPPSVIRSPQKQRLVRQLPLSCLLLESDSPVLGPDPGARNEPANIRTALAAVADLKGVSPAELAHRVEENALQLFGDGFRGRAARHAAGR